MTITLWEDLHGESCSIANPVLMYREIMRVELHCISQGTFEMCGQHFFQQNTDLKNMNNVRVNMTEAKNMNNMRVNMTEALCFASVSQQKPEITRWWNDLKGSGHGLIQAFAWCCLEEPRKTRNDGRWHDHVSPRRKSEAYVTLACVCTVTVLQCQQ